MREDGKEGNKHAERRGGHPGTSAIHRSTTRGHERRSGYCRAAAGAANGAGSATSEEAEGEGEDDEPCPKVSGSGNKKSMAAKSSPYVKPQGEGGYTA